MPCSFTFDHYKEILELFKENNYEFTSFENYNENQNKQVILRHDIDFSPEHALKLAEIENELNIRSNYHFLISSEMYNLFSKDVLLIIEKIKKFNHHIGLHFDPTAFGTQIDENNISGSLTFLKEIFKTAEIALGKLEAYSFHRPATYGMSERIFTKRNSSLFPLNAYDEQFTKNILYLSDSRKKWRNGCVCKQIDELAGRSLQLLIHPIWWTSELKNREENLSDFKTQMLNMAEKYLQNNLSFYNNNNRNSK